MGSDRLTALQVRILQTLAGLDPPWTLTGGAALVGFHLGNRTTRGLDLFLHGRSALEGCTRQVVDALHGAGFAVRSLQTGNTFQRLQVVDGAESVVVDLVADPVPTVESPDRHALGDKEILVDTPHEILVNKLCALVQRTELRDLQDVRDLLAAGGPLERAVEDAPKKDGGARRSR